MLIGLGRKSSWSAGIIRSALSNTSSTRSSRCAVWRRTYSSLVTAASAGRRRGGAAAQQRGARGVAVQEVLAPHRADLAGAEQARRRHRAAQRLLEDLDVAVGPAVEPAPAAVAREQQRRLGARVEALRREQQLEVLARGHRVAHGEPHPL